MLILSREDVKNVLDIAELFDALKEGFRMLAEKQWDVPLRTAIEMKRQDGIALFMPAYCEGLEATGMKLVTIMSRNPEKKLPLIHSSYLYVSAATGQILSLMDAELLTALRTATTSALVADLLGKSSGRTLAIFGTGVQAWAHVEVFTHLFPIGEVMVYGLNQELGEEFASRIERQLRKPARTATLAELKRADLICACTTNATPVFEFKDVRPGVHITGMGSYRPTTREIAGDVMANSTIVVDSYEGAFNEAGDIVLAINDGSITRENVYASVAEIVAETKTIPGDLRKTTVFKSLGMAMEDLVAAELAYRKAREKGVGTEVRV
jgi:ornithine cyclodeaminase/alanine dehydrogenase-like protein (mu-crystallin family)